MHNGKGYAIRVSVSVPLRGVVNCNMKNIDIRMTNMVSVPLRGVVNCNPQSVALNPAPETVSVPLRGVVNCNGNSSDR